jgi:NADH-quinone oxidoreductase subunit J
MDLAFIAFLVFALTAVAAAIGVISVRNPVHAALSLVLTFFSVACIWLIAGAEFLGVALILVYVGAVMVLLLFVVMMLDIDVAPLREGFVRFLPVGLLVAVVMLVEVLVLIGVKAQIATPLAADPSAGISNTEWLGRALFTDFLLPFETAAVILTVAVIAAVMLTLRRREGAKHQNPGEQARVRASDRLRMVKVDPVRPAPAQPPRSLGDQASDVEVKP